MLVGRQVNFSHSGRDILALLLTGTRQTTSPEVNQFPGFRDMESNRQGEAGSAPFRTGRFFSVNGNWYFSTREGTDCGPYRNRSEAEAALSNLVRNKTFRNNLHRQSSQFLHDQEPSTDSPGEGYRFYW